MMIDIPAHLGPKVYTARVLCPTTEHLGTAQLALALPVYAGTSGMLLPGQAAPSPSSRAGVVLVAVFCAQEL